MTTTDDSLFDGSIPSLEHSEALDLLPWLPQDDMPAEQRRGLLVHLDACPDCRRELLFLSELRAALDIVGQDKGETSQVEQGLTSVLQRIDAQDIDSPHSNNHSARFNRRQTMTWRLAAVFAFLVLGFGWTALRHSETSPDPFTATTFETLSNSSDRTELEANEDAPHRLSIGFQAGTPLDRVIEILRTVDGQVVAGPSALGIFVVDTPHSLSLIHI